MNILDLVNDALEKHVAAEVANAETEHRATIDAQATEIAALKSTITARNETITLQNTEIAALKARIAALEAGAPTTPPAEPTDPTPPVDEEPGPVATDTIFYDRAQIMQRPTSGAAWERLAKRATGTWAAPNLGDNNAQGDADVVAGALYAVRTGDAEMRLKVVKQLNAAVTSPLTRTLELGRGLAGYVEAANLIGYADKAFIDWVFAMVTRKFGSGDRWGSFETILETALAFNSNWATQCRRSVIVASMYLRRVGTAEQEAQAEEWLKLGVLSHKRDVGVKGSYTELPPLTSSPSGWYGDSNPIVGINPVGTTQVIGGVKRYIGGVRGADWLRTKRTSDGKEDREATQWPPNPVTYMYEGLTPQAYTAAILYQAGLVPFDAADNAIVRAMNANYGRGENAQNTPRFVNPATGDDKSITWLVNHFAGTDFPTEADDMPDKAGYGHAQWMYGSDTAAEKAA